ncbi:hypothetical protein DPMN_093289 [Dreissena polymorpha]|uniref:Uncharacterized protein n=1 Tax=Dreissena polymorpha TaxID=45954 RepID=A0A9D4R2E8_DREPO|nr:hypothetical protein DPMN_093289 [Dreissena polymorpha]
MKIEQKNVASRVFTRKTDPPTGGHVFQQTRFTVELNQHIIKTNILTNFELVRDIIGTKILTKKTARPPGNHVFQRTGTIFELNSHIKETNVLTKFHENWTKNVTSRVFTFFHYIHIEKNAPPTGGHVFSPIWTIFALVREISKTNFLTNFHDDWAKILTSGVFTRKTAPPTDGHAFQRTGTTFELNQPIIKTSILTKLHEDWFRTRPRFHWDKSSDKFHEDRTINVASRVFTNKCRRRTKTDHKSSPEQSGELIKNQLYITLL